MEKYTLSVLVYNQPGALARVSSLFSRRGFNIESLAVGTTNRDGISRMTIRLLATPQIVEQMVAQIQKLMSVIVVQVLPQGQEVARELLLIKVQCDQSSREAVARIVDIFRARIIDVSRQSMTVEITGEEEKNSAFIEMLQDYGIIEMARTGMVALERGIGSIKNIG